ncbi:MAG: class I SAM-dependent methyltransferase [Phenylobacterium sp.]|uniref:class I SAM-dependent methyltransferase n=1 Tax=Phenylobacterium sp. TaxID=1871053 RepID=UPI00121E9030|nr:class I SAM-dependent methyltransferase [Phenylobacterium sp.]TAJ68741.1 MAG: class I SAM-dependent methyltransferase [Phenylobacterium sp.]
MAETPRSHWETVYGEKRVDGVSWFEAKPARSLALIDSLDVALDDAIIDVGGGASLLVDELLRRGFRDLSVLDIAINSLALARARLGTRAAEVSWLVEDVTLWQPPRDRYALWHDRAVFHFLIEAADRQAYMRAVTRGLRPGGHLILATFAPSGPERCSGLPVQRYHSGELAAAVGPAFELIRSEMAAHLTPGGATQDFTWCVFEKRGLTS